MRGVRNDGLPKRHAPPRPLADRFNEKIERGAHPDDCWLWTGGKDSNGYGSISDGPRPAKRLRAHVVALALDGRPVPRGKVGCHRCGNPPCVNPAHLYVGTQRENMADAVAAGTIARGPRHGQFKHGRYAK